MSKADHQILRVLAYSCRGILAVIVVVGASGIYYWLAHSKAQPQASDDANKPSAVIVMSAQPQLVTRQWQGYGTAQALNSADVPARITATVEHIPAEILEGNAVERGEVLVQLDDSDFVRQVEIAEQNIADLNAQLIRLAMERVSWEERVRLTSEAVKLAEADFERIEDAFRRSVAKPREVDQARQKLINAIGERVTAEEESQKLQPRESSVRAQILAQQSSLRLAQQNVDRARITSPLSGVLQFVDIEIGESVTSGQRIARVVDLDAIEVPLVLPASARNDIAIGDRVELAASGATSINWTSQVSRIAPEDDADRRAVTVYVVLDAEELGAARTMLPPGKFVRGTVFSSAKQQRYVVPRRAMLEDSVLVVDNVTVTRLQVNVDYHMEGSFPQLGLADTQWVVLAEPLPKGALVVVDVGRTLRIGATVEPMLAGSAEVAARPADAAPMGLTR